MGGTDRTGLRLDLSGLAEEHVHEQATPKDRRTAVRRLLAASAVVIGALVGAVLLEGPGALVRTVLLGAGYAVLAHLLDRPRWRPRTLVRPEELVVRARGMLWADRFAWDGVVRVECRPGRATPGRALLTDGRRVPLPGVRADDVARLSTALEQARTSVREHP